VEELGKTRFRDLSIVTLGSRNVMCVHEAVRRLGSSARINERCLELQQGGKKKTAAAAAPASGGAAEALLRGEGALGKAAKVPSRASCACPFYAEGRARGGLADEILAAPMDLEELMQRGREAGACPYYASRRALVDADIVVCPYNTLLHRETREALGVDLAHSVVVVDEAHNLLDAVNGVHSSRLTYPQLRAAHSQVAGYYGRFRGRMAPGNARHVQTLLHLAVCFLRALRGEPPAPAEAGGGGDALPPQPPPLRPASGQEGGASLHSVNAFLSDLNIDGVNLFRLVRYCRESKVLFKMSGYGDFSQAQEGRVGGASPAPQEEAGPQAGALHALVGFIAALTHDDSAGRVLVVPPGVGPGAGSRGPSLGELKFVLLNAAEHFREVTDRAHAVVLAGGTLKPVEDLVSQLLPHMPPEKVHTFSCGHVVSPDRILPLALARGPSGAPLEFKHENRSNPAALDELGRLLVNVCKVVPQGVVCFLPSFAYEEQVHRHFASTGVLGTLGRRKRVFREPRSAADVEKVLKDYAAANERPGAPPGGLTGALLFSVVGGKMSEGINFSDGLGRCVVMVGLPYPNARDPELLERLRFLDRPVGALRERDVNRAAPGGGARAPPPAGSALKPGTRAWDFYENLCMKAVNQSIGRAIRHRGDYAAIIFADRRYCAGTGAAAKIPTWIAESFRATESFGQAYGALAQFFRKHSAHT